MAQPQVRSQIIGLLATKRQRGLVGDNAIKIWTTAALEVLLQAELERIENRSNSDAK
jgi:hypothetical protein